MARDAKGKVFTTRCEAVNAMLLNEFLKEYRNVEEQAADLGVAKARVKSLETHHMFRETIAQLQSALKEQAAEMLKIEEQLSTVKGERRLAKTN